MMSVYQKANIEDVDIDERYTKQLLSVNLPPPAEANSDEYTSHQFHVSDSSNESLDMTAVSIVGLIALIIFTLFLITITIIVVRFRNKDDRHKDKNDDLEQYRRVPLIPLEGGNLCCDTAASSTKSCSCYSRFHKNIK